MAALAYTNAGIIQYAGLPYPYVAHPHAHVVPAITQYSHVDYTAVPAAVHVAAPWPYHVAYPHVPIVVAAPAVAVAKAPATYTAQTRGSLHTAPLEGHEVSQTSLNLEPAPGSE
jgi:Cuticle protein